MSQGKTHMTRDDEIAVSRFLGQHVTREKAAVLFVVTSLLCLSPILLGLRFYDLIPATVETGLYDLAGNDDSLPRWALIYVVPGLFFALNAICHAQLFINQQRQKLPPRQVRIVGRWVIPIIGYFFGAWAISSAAGQSTLSGRLAVRILAVVLMLIGAQMFDCKRDALVAMHFKFAEKSDSAWQATHRVAGLLLMLVGLLFCVSVLLI